MRISKHKNLFAKCYVLNLLEQVSVINKVKNTILETYVISDVKGEEIAGMFLREKIAKTNLKRF